MPALFIILFLLLLIAILGVSAFLYLSAKGVAKLFGGALGASSLPRSIKRSVQESRQYGRMITRTVQQCPPGPMRDRLSLTIKPVDEWLTNLAKLERGLEKSYKQRNLTRELRQVGFEIEKLHREVLVVGKAEAAYLRELLASKRQHQKVLKELQAFQTQAELKIRKIASDLGATHAEILLIAAKGDFNENRLNRLDENLQDHISSMRDVLMAMEEAGYSRSIAP